MVLPSGVSAQLEAVTPLIFIFPINSPVLVNIQIPPGPAANMLPLLSILKPSQRPAAFSLLAL